MGVSGRKGACCKKNTLKVPVGSIQEVDKFTTLSQGAGWGEEKKASGGTRVEKAGRVASMSFIHERDIFRKEKVMGNSRKRSQMVSTREP